MTSAQLQTSGRHRSACAALLAAAALWAPGCDYFPQSPLKRPLILQSPDPHPRLWAVAPFANESGVSTVDADRVADDFREELEQVNGIDTIAVNRVLAAMRAAGIGSVSTPAEAMQLIGLLDVDALVVGTVTTWDPYPPPSLGMAVLLFERPGEPGSNRIDPRDLVRAPSGTDAVAMGELGPARAAAQATGVFDSRNNQVLTWLNQYATGRTEPNEAFGTDVYLMDMDLYTKFVSFRLIHDLLAFEQARMQPAETATRR
jgi:hypothetical protein